MLKYKWMCVAVFCCAMFAACEPTEVASDQNPISFNNGPARAQKVEDTDANARIWAYYTTSTTPATTYDVYGSITGNTTASQTPSTPTGKGENASLTITEKDGNLSGALLVNGNTKYWTDGTYDFFSIYSEKFKNTSAEPTFNFNNGTLSFSYDISDQQELRYACHLNTPGAANRKQKVDFNYQHLLSRVKFQGFSTDSESPITVTSVSVANIPSKATVSMNIGGVSTTDAKSLTATYSLSTTDKFTISNSSADGMTCNNTDGHIVLDKMVFPSNEALKGLTFSVTYNTLSETNKTKTATLPAYNFEAGKSYILKFYIQPSGPIIFGGVTVEPWDKNDTSNDQNLDFDTTQNNN